MEREHIAGQRTDPCGTPWQTRKKRLMLLKNHASAPVTKERLNLLSKARMETIRNKLV